MKNATHGNVRSFALLIVSMGIAASYADAKSIPRLPATSKTYYFGKNVKPSYVRETTRSDGSKSYVYGQQVDKNGRVIGPHGHNILRDGKVSYARNMGGGKIYDDRK